MAKETKGKMPLKRHNEWLKAIAKCNKEMKEANAKYIAAGRTYIDIIKKMRLTYHGLQNDAGYGGAEMRFNDRIPV